jgi:hypothetical protein
MDGNISIEGPRPIAATSRAALIANLTARVQSHEAEHLSHRAAIRRAAAEVGLHPMQVKRLVDLWPEA